MKIVKIIIERSKDAFWAYAENLEGVSGVGNTVLETKKSVLESFELQRELGNIPNKKYSFAFRFDTESLLNYYKGIFTNAAFEKITGIHQKQIQHYASGLKKPRLAQAKKIETALHSLGRELIAVEL
jgi:hypothetical protein